MLFAGYPGVKTYVTFIAANYVLYLALFLLAVFLATTPDRNSRAIPHVLRGVAALLFLLSFNMNSLLVFHYGFVALLAVWWWKSRRSADLTWLLVYASLPLLYWITKQSFFPRHAEFAAYNQFQHSPVTVASAVIRFAIAVYGELQDVLRELWAQPLLVLLTVGLICLVGRRLESKYPNLLRCSSRPERSVIFGILLLGLGAFPYVVVGLAPADAWSSRHEMLVGLPLAIIVLGVTGVVEKERRGMLSLASLSVLGLIVVGFTLTTVHTYIGWQARWVKDRSIMLNLSRMPELRKVSVFWIDDESGIGPAQVYDFYEWSGMFKAAWGEETHIGFDRRAYGPDALMANAAYYNKRYNLSGLDRCGQQATLTILKGEYIPDDWKLALRYFQSRRNNQTLGAFLSTVTQVEWHPVSARIDNSCVNE